MRQTKCKCLSTREVTRNRLAQIEVAKELVKLMQAVLTTDEDSQPRIVQLDTWWHVHSNSIA